MVPMMHSMIQGLSQFRIRKSRRAQGMAEFAVALPILLFIVLGFIEAARWFQAYLAVQYAATEAARYAVSGRPPMITEAGGETGCDNMSDPDTGFGYTMPGDYVTCRYKAIRDLGRDLAGVSLLFDPNQTDITKPYYLGVHVRGSPDYGSAPIDFHPGVARTKVEITIVFNHPVSNPFFATMLPTIRVVGRVQMVNEPWEGGAAEAPEPIPTATALPPLDTDGDGWSDVDENKIYGTYPSNVDTDGDGCKEGPDGPDDTSEEALDPSKPYAGGC
jgi:hypothetical protein